MSISGPTGGAGLSLAALQAQNDTRAAAPRAADAATEAPSFAQRLGQAVDQVAQAQQTASQSASDFEAGRTDDLARVMVDQQVASLGFELTLQVRNKALTAYRDIMNMPV
ncbi:flagellar hook-basal body complex protein FliE [Rhodovulum bhavnagarense]|uniref:Flagellar hook-basal body complex protein FliE n=1 Tax=Rhodovulum bhavnagarense TaxID=992286 RepID=A0A4R2RGZ0_9RHOB|nr:flagellar hook-basal body complex protein FliE [Rhodovulum bhavnagarense]TCP61377.1 flagellar hook-basal body complex protein FliE [Rhodovulum bhavnagarense]